MKKILSLLTILCFAFSACGNNDDEDEPKPADNQENNQEQNTENQEDLSEGLSGKTLLIYYSYTGNSKAIVNEFLKTVEADVLEVLPAQEGLKYEADNYKIGSELIAAIRANPDKAESYPEIKPYEVDFKEYNNIVIATPLWWSNMAAPMQTFLFQEGNNLADKNIMLIVSSASSGISAVVDDAKRLVSKGKFVGEALWINNSNRSEMPQLLSQWIDTQKFSKQ